MVHAVTHIWVLSDALDDILVEVARVAHELPGDVVGVLHALEQGVNEGEL